MLALPEVPARYALVRELADDDFPAAVACRALNISRSGYKDWVGRPQSPRDQRNTELLKLIRDIHETSRHSYGSPRVHAELTLGLNLEINRKRVERLMREAGIQGIYRRKGRRNLVNAATEEDLVRRGLDGRTVALTTDDLQHSRAQALVMLADSRPSGMTAEELNALCRLLAPAQAAQAPGPRAWRAAISMAPICSRR